MDFMDIDDTTNGQIKEFLLRKLQNAKDCTNTLQCSIEIRQNLLDQLHKQLKKEDNALNIKEISKKILHGNYVIQVDVVNDSDNDCYNPQCMLHWNSSEELVYTTAYYVKTKVELSKNLSSKSLTTLKIDIQKPKFHGQNSYIVNGIITYSISSDSKLELQSILPQFSLNVDDFSKK